MNKYDAEAVLIFIPVSTTKKSDHGRLLKLSLLVYVCVKTQNNNSGTFKSHYYRNDPAHLYLIIEETTAFARIFLKLDI